MKKRFISALLAVCMVLTLCPAVRADGDPGYADGAPRNFVRIHWSGGEWIYEKGYGSSGALPSGVSFNAASGTLTLRNADLGLVDIYAWGANKVTIVAEGVNTLSSLSISACHNVEIRGSGTINAGPDAPAEAGTVLVGEGMTATDDATGKTVPIDDQFRRHISGSAVTVSGGSFRSEEHEITYDPELNEVKTLTVTNMVHGRTGMDAPVEEKLVIDYINGRDSADYYAYWPELPTFTFWADFVEDASTLGSVTVVTTDCSGAETRVPLRYHQADGAWIGSHDYDEKSAPRKFRVEYAGVSSAELEYVYDDTGRIKENGFAGSAFAHMSYSPAGDAMLTFDILTSFGLGEGDPSGTVRLAPFEISKMEQDSQGRMVKLVTPDGLIFDLSYDAGHPPIMGQSGSPTEVSIRDNDGNVLRATAASGDPYGYRLDVTLSNGESVSYSTNRYGNFTGITDGAGNTTDYLWGGDDLTAIRYPDGVGETFSYDAEGRMTGWTNRAGEAFAYSYDSDGNLVRTAHSGGEENLYTYDGSGNLISIRENGQETRIAYDPSGDPVQVI